MLKEILSAVREQRQKESMRLGVEREEMMSWYLVVTGGGMEVEVFFKVCWYVYWCRLGGRIIPCEGRTEDNG